MAKEAVIFIADTHCNSTLGLCAPGLYRDDGEPYQLNDIQLWLLRTFEQCQDDIENLTKDYYTHLVLAGDIVDLDSKQRSWQTISRNPSLAVENAHAVLEPLLHRVDNVFVLRGTEAHTGISAYGEEELARDIDAEPDPERHKYSWWHLRAEFSRVSFDIAHHANMGGLPHTYATAAMRLVTETMYYYNEWGETPPDYVVRAHNHRYADSGLTFPTRGIYLPCWQFKTSYIHRIGKANGKPQIGAVVIRCDNGESDLKKLMYKPPRSKPWRRSLIQDKQ